MIEEKEIKISAHKLAFTLFLVAISLTALHVTAMLVWHLDLLPVDNWIYFSFFDLDEEESIGTWFSTLILFAAALLSLFN